MKRNTCEKNFPLPEQKDLFFSCHCLIAIDWNIEQLIFVAPAAFAFIHRSRCADVHFSTEAGDQLEERSDFGRF